MHGLEACDPSLSFLPFDDCVSNSLFPLWSSLPLPLVFAWPHEIASADEMMTHRRRRHHVIMLSCYQHLSRTRFFP